MIRKTLDRKYSLTNSQRWIDGRVSGKNSALINQELDRIESEIEQYVLRSERTSQQRLENEVERIIRNAKAGPSQVNSIGEYFEDFITQKKTEVNPRTKKLLSSDTIRDYRTAFRLLDGLELEDITKINYHAFTGRLLAKYEANYIGKVVRKLKTFFIWCNDHDLPINKEYKFWKPFNEDTKQEERALNSDQLRKLYELEVDPVDVYQIAKKTHKKDLDGRQVEQLCKSIKDAANQSVAMASIGAHKEDFWKLTSRNVSGNIIRYYRGKNNIECIAPFRDNYTFHSVEFADLSGGPLFKRMTGINYYLTYVRELCKIPFKITASNFRKTFGSIIWNETSHPNKLGIIMKAYGHKKETTTRKYLGIQIADLEKDHEELFNE